MSNEGDKTAKKAVNDIRQMIEDDEKYSTVENTIIIFLKIIVNYILDALSKILSI